MATPPVRQWGVTPPISTVLPTKDELSANDDLIAELKAQNNFELPTETERRKQVLQLLQRVTVEFVQVVSRKKGLSPAAVEASGDWVYTDQVGVHLCMDPSSRARIDNKCSQAPISIP
ncbi:hypothetical protein N7516_005509 [Penicillium verrucosum]|uniref:uncharacterized protein n=1 Tax=Penicillium verrucosum TaxID=60171 RepID=UPI00254598DE|nr:uncharacterized protein N7516_005509 [Penicillium verrucosum]KAJ5945341.1 hypothetical protein N7516_005509 [Penicillium verrucosum]